MPRTPSPIAPKPREASNSLVAAAVPVTGANMPRRKSADSWQLEAWAFYDAVGPLRYAGNWYSNACSKAKLIPMRITPQGPVALTEGPAVEAMDELYRSFGGPAEFIKALALHDFMVGECYLVGFAAGKRTESGTLVPTASKGEDIWLISSVEEIRKRGTDTWELDYGDGEKVALTDADTVLRIWTPSPRRRWFADSPVKAALPDLREIATAGRHISAQMWSRLAGAGLLLVPSEITFAKPVNYTIPDGTAASADADPLLVNIGQTMMASMNDPGSVESFVPIILKVPGEYVDKVKHVNFYSVLDEKAVEIRQDAKKNLATTLDMPAEVILGTADMNHWGAWQVDESAVKTHIEPGLARMAANLTVGYLRTLSDIEDDVVLGFDSAALRLRPNRSKEALELYDRGELRGVALLRETGFEETDGYTEADSEEFQRWLLKKIAGGSATPEMVLEALSALGVEMPKSAGVAYRDTTTNNRQSRPDPSLVDHPDVGPPAPDDAQTASLMATCEAVTYRALERAGNRLKNRGVRPPGMPADKMHTVVQCKQADLPMLLEGAWTPLPTLLHRTGYDANVVTAALDAYARNLLLSQNDYEPDAMQRFLFTALGVS